MKKPLSCYFGLHDWDYYEFVIMGNDCLQKRKCKWCGQKEGRVITANRITGWC